jgi:hypothetical protein
MMAACPQSWENMAKVNTCPAEEEVLFIIRLIGEKNAHLMRKAPNLAWW